MLPHDDRESRLHGALAEDRIGAWGVALAIGSSVAPLTVVAGVVITALAVTGQPGIAVGIAAVGVLLLVFLVGYLAMARRIRNAGAFYAFAARSLGRPVAVSVAVVALVAYTFFQVGTYGGLGAVAAPLLSDAVGLDVAWWAVALAAWVVVAVLGLFAISVSEKVLGVLVAAETLVVLVYASALISSRGFAWTWEPLAINNLWGPAAGTLAAIGFTAFAGLESSAAYAEEVRDAGRNVPRATYAMVGAGAIVYTFSAVVIVSAVGSGVYERAAAEGPALFFGLAGEQLGGWAVNTGFALFATSLLAAGIAFHHLLARLAFALGREGVLPRVFGRTAGGAPRYASIAQSVIGLSTIAVIAFAGLDPLTDFFFIAATSGGLGVALLVTVTAGAVIAFFRRDGRGEIVWRRAVAPWLALPGLLYVTYLMITNLPTLYGTDGWTGPALIVPLVYLAAAAVGLLWGWALAFLRPVVYLGIGSGAGRAAVTSAASTSQHATVGVGR